ncbi:MAG TPA: signal recognition particle-docking protein FtsY [Actinomycetota bacterium]|nr:signal recognition particle-docking protein FtsY [Actinomycetota bacterium]
MEIGIILFVVLALAVVAVSAGLVVRRRRAGDVDPARPAGGDRVLPSAVTHPAPQRPEPLRREPGPSGGVFRRDGLGSRVKALFSGGAGDDTWRALEDLLVKADVGPKAATELVGRVRAGFAAGADPVSMLRDEIIAILGPDELLHLPSSRPGIVMVVGVNGSGKTTTIGKLAKRLTGEGKQVSLAAADTFRAAAGEQLEVWATRAGAHLVSQDRGADPGAVAFDAVKSATARGSDVVIVDTAGRLHTKTPLMEELGKIGRVIEKAGAEVDETLLVLDAQTGQNGIAQARAFTDAVEVTGVVLTKTDGSAKGGIVLAVRQELGVPVRFVGVGEGADDLRPFEAAAFADRLLSD